MSFCEYLDEQKLGFMTSKDYGYHNLVIQLMGNGFANFGNITIDVRVVNIYMCINLSPTDDMNRLVFMVI